jgi:hypothetical protein
MLKLIVIHIFIFIIFSCQSTNRQEEEEIEIEIEKIEEIEINLNDYELIDYNKSGNGDIHIKIINLEKINKLKENNISIIYINYKDKLYLARSHSVYAASIPEECDYFYIVKKGKILSDDNEILFFDYKRFWKDAINKKYEF